MKLMIKMAVVRDLELNSLKITPVTNVKPPLIRKNWAGEIFLFGINDGREQLALELLRVFCVHN